jgi:hypothetical protein
MFSFARLTQRATVRCLRAPQLGNSAGLQIRPKRTFIGLSDVLSDPHSPGHNFALGVGAFVGAALVLQPEKGSPSPYPRKAVEAVGGALVGFALVDGLPFFCLALVLGTPIYLLLTADKDNKQKKQ